MPNFVANKCALRRSSNGLPKVCKSFKACLSTKRHCTRLMTIHNIGLGFVGLPSRGKYLSPKIGYVLGKQAIIRKGETERRP